MATNVFAGSDAGLNQSITFTRPVNHLNIFVATGVVFSMSFDGEIDYITVSIGFHSIPIGAIKQLDIAADGAWQLVAVQS